ncbi:hypothetical protein GGTG_00046 [Gaeumannomyces tritici R3-111a-1]|uniref:Uncharacterized protein n=1 Tax=Gaeumannomyces tritici (strain R3-111a-1) TaxID=644352 RepID=J3NFK0_GAET3|nr:hypothetical protein GGTG_00046 [Gaeumannomyces tritici R3-111a-1]EJT80040.1 hypothetical protein GGTG_00046 [Gaeumannomyces tritici R3-111a-1]
MLPLESGVLTAPVSRERAAEKGWDGFASAGLGLARGIDRVSDLRAGAQMPQGRLIPPPFRRDWVTGATGAVGSRGHESLKPTSLGRRELAAGAPVLDLELVVAGSELDWQLLPGRYQSH